MNPSSRWSFPDLRSALYYCRTRNREGVRCILHVLGEYVQNREMTGHVLEEYLRCLEGIHAHALNASVSVKLTQLGALLDPQHCEQVLARICSRADQYGIPVELDMEGRDLVPFTIDTALAMKAHTALSTLTLTLQAYLERTGVDIHAAVESGLGVRLVKGAYVGDWDDFGRIEDEFRKDCTLLAGYEIPFAVGTHDPDLVDYITKSGIEQTMIEFGFLYGFAEHTKMVLREAGWKVAEYIPYGPGDAGYAHRRERYLQKLGELGREPVP
jgi:proline dehydrogenase